MAQNVALRDAGIAALMPTQTGGGYALITAIPKQDPSNPAVGATIDRLRAALPAGSLIGGAVAENHDLQAALSAKTPLVIGVVLGLGFLLLLIALQAPLLAAVGVLTNLLATGAAFGVAKWIFQDGALHSLLGFQSQGFLDAWGPVFFFAMIFAISMDYTVFLLSSGQGALGPHPRPAHGDGRRLGALGPGDLRRRRGDGRGVLHVRAVGAAAAQGDGDHPRRRGAARRSADPPVAAAGTAAADGPVGVVPAEVGTPGRFPTSPSDTHEFGSDSHVSITIELWQTEWCPASHRVRQRLTELGLTYTVHQVPVHAEARVQLRAATGASEIPVLVVDGSIVSGEQAILAYVNEHYIEPPDAAEQRAKAAKARQKELEAACPKLTAATP